MRTGRRSTKRSKRASTTDRWSNSIEVKPLQYLLEALNDDSVPAKLGDAIAKKLLPRFHEKLRPISHEEVLEAAICEAEAEEADTAAERRAYIRRVAFRSY